MAVKSDFLTIFDHFDDFSEQNVTVLLTQIGDLAKDAQFPAYINAQISSFYKDAFCRFNRANADSYSIALA